MNLAAEIAMNAVLLGDLPGGLADNARIVGIASTSGVAGNKGQTNYAASKAGVMGLVWAQAEELADRPVTVNAVAPGFIETDMTAAIPVLQRGALGPTKALSPGGQPERKVAPAHHRQLQAEREHVQPGRGDGVAQREATHRVVGRQPVDVLGVPQHRGAGARQPRHPLGRAADADQRAGQQRPAGRQVGVDDLSHQAPTRFWPHTRTTWPLTPPEAGSHR